MIKKLLLSLLVAFPCFAEDFLLNSYRYCNLSRVVPGAVAFYDSITPSTLFESSDTSDPAEIGDTIGYWLDQSGNGNHLTQATGASRPTWTANQINSQPSLYADGGDVLANTAVSSNLAGQANFTIYYLSERNFSSANRDLYELATSGGSILWRLRAVSTNSNYSAGTTYVTTGFVSSTRSWGNINEYTLRKVTNDGTNQRHYYAGANDTDAGVGGIVSEATPVFRIFDSPTGANWAGGVVLFGFWPFLMSSDEQTAFETCVAQKFPSVILP